MRTSRTFVDPMGRAVEVPRDPQRLVSLVPSITEALFTFGWGKQIVGITNYCSEPAAAVVDTTTIGGTKNPDIAKIIALRPHVVFAVAEENRRQDVAQLEAAGIPVFVFEPRTVRHGIDMLWRIADLLDCRTEIRPLLEEIEQDYRQTRELVAQRPRVSVFCPIWKDPYMTISQDTYVHDTLLVCGGDNVFASRQRRFPLAADLGQQCEAIGIRHQQRDRRYPRVTLEEMASLRPDVILLPDEPYRFTESDKADFSRFIDVPAVRHGRVHLIDGKMVSWYGPRIGRSLRTLRVLFMPS
jgi:ABC-type Fe3+-hydroxamate transport system substrate-binding protein